MSEETEEPGGGPLAVGRIIRPHGIRGAVIVEVMSDVPDRFVEGARLLLERGDSFEEVTLLACSASGLSRVVVALPGVEDATAAERLRGRMLHVPAEETRLDEGQYWEHELIGMRVTDGAGDLGVVCDIAGTAAQDCLVVDHPEGRYMVPLVDAFVKEVDRETGTITVELIEGLGPGC